MSRRGSLKTSGGSTDRVETGTWNVHSDEISVHLWVYATSFAAGRDDRYLSKSAGGAANQHVFMLGSTDSTGRKLRARAKNNSTTTVSSIALPTGEWVSAGFSVYENNPGVASLLELYQDGVVVGADSGLGIGLFSLTSDPVLIGNGPATTSTNAGDVQIAYVSVWDRCLSPDEFVQLSMGAHPCDIRPKRLIACYPLANLLARNISRKGRPRGTVVGALHDPAHPPVREWIPREWFLPIVAGAPSGDITGTAAMGFGAGSSTLTGAGALAGSAALTFGAGSSTLTGAGVLAGSAAAVFGEGSSTLTGAGALAGSAANVFGAGSSTLVGAGALAGSADAVFGAGSSTLTGAGVLAGSAAQVFTVTGLVENFNAGSIAGSAAMLFGAGASVMAGAGALAGSADAVFGAGSSTLTGAGALAGSAAQAFGAGSSTLIGAGALAGAAAAVFTPQGTLDAVGLSGQSDLFFSASGTLVSLTEAIRATGAGRSRRRKDERWEVEYDDEIIAFRSAAEAHAWLSSKVAEEKAEAKKPVLARKSAVKPAKPVIYYEGVDVSRWQYYNKPIVSQISTGNRLKQLDRWIQARIAEDDDDDEAAAVLM